jgi:hypothetical protein
MTFVTPTRPRAVSANRDVPDRLVMIVDGLDHNTAQIVARSAVFYARAKAPKLTGASARRFEPIFGDGFFGIHWMNSHVWFQNRGIRPFTMRNLAGKTIPMWVDDPGGEERRKNPKAKTRVTASGKRQTLIFRKAAKRGQRKKVKQPDGTTRDVPASYPGAPGRIGARNPKYPWAMPGRVFGGIATGNVGVRWRHPGLSPRSFLEYGLMRAAVEHLLPFGPIVPTEHSSFRLIVGRR